MFRFFIKIGCYFFPNKITAIAYNKLTNPQTRKLRDNELITLQKSTEESLEFKGFSIKLYTWKGGPKKILLIHGWEGQAGNFSDIIEHLLKHNYTIHAFDAPSHGFSSVGKTSLFEFTELVGLLIKKFKVKNLISHSFGGVATTYALYKNTDIEIDKYILLTTPDKFIQRIESVSQYIGINDKVKNKLIQKLEKENNIDVKMLNVSEFVKAIPVRKSLIIHDKNDKVIPIEQSLNVYKNWKESQLKVISGTGHFRILRTKMVIDEILNYLE